MIVRVSSRADVVRYTLIITALTVVVPVIVAASILLPMYQSSRAIYFGGIAIAGLIPFFITPPLAIVSLHMVRLLTETIDRIDNHVRFDALTGVYNRGHFLDRVRASRADGMMLIVDVDHFKLINDTYGHDAGDEALKLLGSLLNFTVGALGLVGRLGGEEFAVFLPNAPARDGATMAKKLCEAVRACTFKAGDAELRLTISIGGDEHRESLPIGHSLKVADERLYRAKNEGRDRYLVEVPVRSNPIKPVKLVRAG
jgi:diguanylate cyclase (GGDEF)-like protein